MLAGSGYDIRYGHGILDLAGALVLADGGTLARAPVVDAPVALASTLEPPDGPAPRFWQGLYQQLSGWLRGGRSE
jgi:hypothetical protein